MKNNNSTFAPKMFTANPYIGVAIAILFIVGMTLFVVWQTKPLVATERILFLLIFLIAVQVAVWTVDNVIAFKIQLLTDEENKAIFNNIDTIVKLVLGYYIGTKKNE